MRHRWRLGLAVVGLPTTFTLGSSAGLLRQEGEEPIPTPPSRANSPSPSFSPPAPLPLLPPAAALPPLPPPGETTAEPAPFVTELGKRPAPRAAKDLDSSDPWSSSPKSLAPPRMARPAPRPLDTADPWTSNGVGHAAPPLPAAPLEMKDPWAAGLESPRRHVPSSSDRRDEAYREAIKRAIDAGDIERAAEMLELLRTPH